MTDILIKNVLQLDGIQYSELLDDKKELIDRTFNKIPEWHETILSFNSERVINIITNDPDYTLALKTDFPKDLAFNILSAYISSK